MAGKSVSRFINPAEVVQLRDEIGAILNHHGNQIALNEFPHPKPYWNARGHTYRHWAIFIMRMGNEKSLLKLKCGLIERLGLKS